MNDVDSTASSSRAINSATHDTNDGAPTVVQLEKRRKENRDMFNRKRGQLLDDLIYNMDILVYAQLSAIYFMDCSFIRFMLRSLIQFVLLTPKPPTLVQPPDQQPFVGAVLITNLLCIFLHLWFVPVAGTEATRGYLHGGLAMDFIGQKGPASRITLVLFDLLVMALQLVHLTAHITRKRLKNGAVATAPPTRRSQSPPSTAQDLDSEERGIRRSAELEQQDEIEMQTLNTSSHAVNPATTIIANEEDDETSEREALLAPPPPQRTDIHIFDSFHSGQIVIADLNILKTTREQFWADQKATGEQREAQRASYRAQLASTLMGFGVTRLGR